ncbi:MAG: leader peptidase (prepilin peptidase) / N-methyltransferase [Patescibacteria group bacterium]|nr:leader peptidase (prepilin peptidase) / N-methyltransferase [Patescibacteria group bacterium]
MIILMLILLGLCLGSFINALIWRLHAQDKLKSKKERNKYSISTGRSMCMHCKHPLSTVDLIPVVSWLWLRGKCRYCGYTIPDNPISELLTPALFVVSYLYWPLTFNTEGKVLFGFWMIYLTGFIALALYDLRWYVLPNRIIFPLMYLAGFQILIQLLFFDYSLNKLLLIGISVLVAGGIFWCLFQYSDGKWIGGGDVKLGFLIGAILATRILCVLYIFIASLIGTLVSLPLMIIGRAKKTSHLPFGPFLLMSTFIVYLFGLSIVDWYKALVGL